LKNSGHASPEDVSAAALEEYLNRLKRVKPKLALLPMEKLLRLQDLTDQGAPTLAGLLLFGELLGATENRFSGIPTIQRAMREQGLPAPVFEQPRGAFRVTLSNGGSPGETNLLNGGVVMDRTPDYTDPTIEEQILEFCKSPRSRNELTRRFPQLTQVYLMTAYVNPLEDKGRLVLSIPEKAEKQEPKVQEPLTRSFVISPIYIR
jgi:ATP-dependent DNA helicase RecG